MLKAQTHWDHMTPFSYSYNNNNDNWAAAHSICNLIKRNLCFEETEDAREYIEERLNKKGITFL